MIDPYIIRDYDPDDVDVFVDKIPEWLKECPAHDQPINQVSIKEYYKELAWLLNGKVIEIHGDLVGGLLYLIHPIRYHYEEEAHEIAFFIDPKHRSYKLASSILSAVEKDLRDYGVKRLVLGANSGHRTEILQKLYLRRGYISMPCNYYKEM